MTTIPAATAADADVVEAVGAHLARNLPLADLLDRALEDRGPDLQRWQSLMEIGLAELMVPEALDGLGVNAATTVEVAVQAGRHLLPHTAREQSILAVPLLAEAVTAGAGGLADGWLGALRAGDLVGGGGAVVERIGARAGIELDRDGRIAGEQLAWLGPDAAVAALAGPDAAFVVPLDHTAVRATPLVAVDRGQGLHRIRVEQLPVTDAVVVDGEAAARVLRTWRLALVAEAHGVGEAMVERAVAYAAEREQFGRPIATFQAVAHMLADAQVGVAAGQSALARAVTLVDGDERAATDGLLLSLGHWLPARARALCEIAVQVHGGNGFTWEYGLHLHYRRALAVQALLGGPRGSARLVGEAVLGRAGS